MKHLVFVYGTLMRGERLDYVLAGQEFCGDAETLPVWAMISLGGFPGIVEGESRVYGELYRVDDETLARLDQIEGVPVMYAREQITVWTDAQGGRLASPQSYVYQGSTENRMPIPHGDWKAYRRHRESFVFEEEETA